MARITAWWQRKKSGKPPRQRSFAAARSGKKVKVREVCKRIESVRRIAKGELNAHR